MGGYTPLHGWDIIHIDEMNTEEAAMGIVSFDFKGEVVVVTGGSRGLGLEIAQAFGDAGAQVVITARCEQWLTEAEKFLKDRAIAVDALIGDVADASSVEKTVQQVLEKFGKVDVLINNAGLTWGAPAESMPLERWRQVIDANITGTFLMSQFVGRHMLEQGKGARVHRRACMQLVRQQRIEVSLLPPVAASPDKGKVILSRPQRAHYRLSWPNKKKTSEKVTAT